MFPSLVLFDGLTLAVFDVEPALLLLTLLYRLTFEGAVEEAGRHGVLRC